jgi:hypothetical protein
VEAFKGMERMLAYYICELPRVPRLEDVRELMSRI